MGRSLNRATLIGNLGQDPEVRTTPQGSTVCNFSIATTEKYKDRNGEWQESTEWHRIVLWDKLAEIARDYLKKGNKIYLEGRIKTRSYEGADGVKRYITEITGINIIMLGGPSEQSGGYQQEKGYSQPSSPAEHLTPDTFDDDKEDDVPF